MRVAATVLASLGLIGGACSFSADAGAGGDTGGDGSEPGVLRRKAITIAGAKIAGNLTGFPVWIDLADPDLAAAARPDASDVSFTDASRSRSSVPGTTAGSRPGCGRRC